MLKYELLRKPEYEFLAHVPQQVVVITGRMVEDGVEVRREIDITATRMLHQMLQARGYRNVPQSFEGMTVVKLDEALSGLFRAHPYTGEPVDEVSNQFHHSQMDEELFLLFLFAQEDDYISKSGGKMMQLEELRLFLTNASLQEQLRQRVARARTASSIVNPDTPKLKAAEARIWYNNPNSAAPSNSAPRQIDWWQMMLEAIAGHSDYGVSFSASGTSNFAAKPFGQGVMVTRGVSGNYGFATNIEEFRQAVISAYHVSGFSLTEHEAMRALQNITQGKVTQKLSEASMADIEALAERLSVDLEMLSGSNKGGKVRSLVQHVVPRGRYEELVAAAIQLGLL